MMRHEVKVAPEELEAKSECHHYWLIESPKGPTSRGLCKLCGAQREFKNYGPDSWQEDDISVLLELPDLLGVRPDREQHDS